MTNFQFMVILATCYLAPGVPTEKRLLLGVVCLILAVVALVLGWVYPELK